MTTEIRCESREHEGFYLHEPSHSELLSKIAGCLYKKWDFKLEFKRMH